MKKIISILLTVVLIALSIPCYASAAKKPLSTSAGIEKLRGQFESGVAPKTDGHALDYEYYSPVGGKTDKTKYPLVIFLHGIGHGEHKGSQLADSNMPYWSSSELQARFSDGGAFILLPRAPEDKNEFWGESFIEPLRALIDDFIRQHKDNVDTTRIAISGSSQGGAMVWMMLEAYPEYFATAFPLASTKTPTPSLVKKASSTAIWLIASEKDPVVNYVLSTLPIWDSIKRYNDNPANCRLSTIGTVYNPDGKKSSDNHHLANVITYDLHTMDNGLYPNMETVDGLGNTVNMKAPNGLIKWISSVHSDFTGNQESASNHVNIFEKVIEIFRNMMLEVVHVVQMILGL